MIFQSSAQPAQGRATNFVLTPCRAVLALIVVTLAIRFVFAASTGLGIDETYTVATSRALVLSTYDHPPMAWWLAWAATHLLGGDSPLQARLPFVLLFAVSTWQMYRLGTLLFDEGAGFLAAFALNCAPVLGVTTATWVLPDGPLIAALLSGAVCIARVLFVPGTRPQLWLAAGFFGGLALLSKYHGVFLFAGAGLFLLTSKPHRRWLTSPWPYAGAVLALLMFSPVIVWNVQHHWASFVFQGQRGAAADLKPWKPFVVLAGQSLFLLPWIWAGLMFSAWKAVRLVTMDGRRWLLFCLGVGPVFVFTIVAAWSKNAVLFHWAAPGYLMWFPMLGADLRDHLISSGNLRRAMKATAALVIALILGVILISAAPWPAALARAPINLRYPLVEMADWRDLSRALEARGLLHRPNLFVATEHWHEAGKADYALDGALPVTCICEDAREYGILAPFKSFVGQDALVLVRRQRASEAEKYFSQHFERITRGEDIVIEHQGVPIIHLALFYGTRLLALSKSTGGRNP